MFELSCHTSGSRTSSSQAMPVSLRAHSAACSAAMFHNAHGTPPRSGCVAQNVRSSAYAVMTDSSVTGIIVWYRRSASVATNSLAAANVSMRCCSAVTGGPTSSQDSTSVALQCAASPSTSRCKETNSLANSSEVSPVTRRRVDNSIGVIRYRSFRFVHSVVSLLGFAASRHKAHLAHLTIAQTTGMAMIASPTTSSHEEPA
ncbi:hypothetical protein GBB89_09590 [Bifidobacterium longum]|nr:hypothetical protein GBB89_09590 [Bifidobacterium longum]